MKTEFRQPLLTDTPTAEVSFLVKVFNIWEGEPNFLGFDFRRASDS
jgi:hypothetical protein